MSDLIPDLNDLQLQKWSDLVEERTGVMIPPERKTFLATGLRARMREIGHTNYDSYYRLMTGAGRWSEEWASLVDRLTVHETSFFRHEPSIRLVREVVLPRFCAENADEVRSFQVWSLGCSTGEEAYTLAMIIQDYITLTDSKRLFGVTATDISLPSINFAKRAIYSERRIATLPKDIRNRYFSMRIDGTSEVIESLRKRICFAQMNVMQMNDSPLRNLDLIYCQNMLIYFARDRRKQLLDMVAQRLMPGGFLVLGPGDVLAWSHKDFERVHYEGTLAFRRRLNATVSV